MFGSLNAERIFCRVPIAFSLITAFFVFRFFFPAVRVTSRPSICSIRRLRSVATKSITFRRSASSAVIDSLFRTAFSTHSSFLPRFLAIPLT